MSGQVWDVITGRLADRWAGLAAPAVVFWVGGVLAWAFAGPDWSRLPRITQWMNDQTAAAVVAALLGASALTAASVIVVQRLTAPVLRLLEGYWPAWLDRLADRRRRRVLERKTAEHVAWQQLQSDIDETETTPGQRSQLARLEARRRHRPIHDNDTLPTRVGNILRAAETRPHYYYGLDAVIVWPRLWLVLPDLARQEVASARASLDASVAAVIWGVAFMVFTPLAWWAAPAGAVVATTAVAWWVPARAETFSDLIEGAFDLYRWALYQQLRWPLPDHPQAEHKSGSDLTKYLDRGSCESRPKFTPP